MGRASAMEGKKGHSAYTGRSNGRRSTLNRRNKKSEGLRGKNKLVAWFKRMEDMTFHICFVKMQGGIFPAFRMGSVDKKVDVAVHYGKMQRCNDDSRNRACSYAFYQRQTLSLHNKLNVILLSIFFSKAQKNLN